MIPTSYTPVSGIIRYFLQAMALHTGNVGVVPIKTHVMLMMRLSSLIGVICDDDSNVISYSELSDENFLLATCSNGPQEGREHMISATWPMQCAPDARHARWRGYFGSKYFIPRPGQVTTIH